MKNRDLDAWWLLSNRLFMDYQRSRMAANPKAWGDPKAAPFRAAVAVLVAYKNAWAQDLAELVELPTPEHVRAYWREMMRRAEGDAARELLA